MESRLISPGSGFSESARESAADCARRVGVRRRHHSRRGGTGAGPAWRLLAHAQRHRGRRPDPTPAIRGHGPKAAARAEAGARPARAARRLSFSLCRRSRGPG